MTEKKIQGAISFLTTNSDIGNTESGLDKQGDCKSQRSLRFSALAVFKQKLLSNGE